MVCNVTCKVASASVPTFPPASSQFTPRSSSTLPGVLFFFFLLRTQAEFFTYIPSPASSQFTLMPSSSPWAVHENTSPSLLCNIILGFRRVLNSRNFHAKFGSHFKLDIINSSYQLTKVNYLSRLAHTSLLLFQTM